MPAVTRSHSYAIWRGRSPLGWTNIDKGRQFVLPSEGCFSDVIPFRWMLQRRKGPFRTPKSSKISNKYFVRELFTLLGHFFLKKYSKTIFKLCPHIQLNTTNPNTKFKISIYCTKYTNNAKIHSKKHPIFQKVQKQIKHFQTIQFFILLYA